LWDIVPNADQCQTAGNLTGIRYRDDIVQPYVIRSSMLRPTTSHFSRTTLDHMLRE
jgi:hypothetical protein